MAESKRPSNLDNEFSTIDGSEWLVVDNGSVVGKMLINRIKSIFSKNDIGLGNADNTSDANKPISLATQLALNGKSDTGHLHAISEVTGLSVALTSKADSVHGHAISDITNLVDALNSKSAIGHTHDYTSVTGLDTAVSNAVNTLVPDLVVIAVGDQLANKSNVGHTHIGTDITDLDGIISSAITAAIPTISASNIQNSMYIAELQW